MPEHIAAFKKLLPPERKNPSAPCAGKAAAATGDTCDSASRPTIVVAHGTSESDPTTFEGLVTHLVSNGNVVIYPTHTQESSDKPSNYLAYYTVRDGINIARFVAKLERVDERHVERSETLRLALTQVLGDEALRYGARL